MRARSFAAVVFTLSIAALSIALTITAPASARSNGIAAEGCNGCHGGGKSPAVTIALDPPSPKPGETATVTVSIPSSAYGGVYLRASHGALASIGGQGTKLYADGSIVHAAPKAASGGFVRFSASWRAPSSPGGVVFDAYAIAANGDHGSGGDGAGEATKSFAFGCAGTTYFRDLDGDGFGGSSTVIDCAKPDGYAETAGDCDDNDPKAHPGADELCNGRDDDCDGVVDEDLVERTQYEDGDGDGWGKSTGKTLVAKCPPAGYAPVAGDCDDRDPAIHPGAKEICNLQDDDCDGRVDDRVRPICGIGLCARESPTCDEASCEPGKPKTETCNGLDDDCDGETDEGDLCPSGQVCRHAECVDAALAEAGADAGPSTTLRTTGCAWDGCAWGSHGDATPWVTLGLVSVLARRSQRRRQGGERCDSRNSSSSSR